jgi:hypothetical protein
MGSGHHQLALRRMARSSSRRLTQVSAALAAGTLLLAAPAPAADPVVAAAGDIACDPTGTFFNAGHGDATHCRAKHTSDMLVRTGLAAALPLGDNQYEQGTLAQFQQSYELSWGRLMSITHPVIGNHEYFNGSGEPPGSGYFDYFNGLGSETGVAGDRDKGYYSFDIGDWHLIALNSVCQEVGGCAAGSAQEQWLRSDLETHQNSCTLAYWHHPFYNSGQEGTYTGTRDLWRALYEGGAELVLNGHAHSYERFAPQDHAGNANSTYGLREIVVGTGGKSLGGWGATQPNSQVRDNQSFGVLKATLHPNSYDWSFVHESGTVADSGTSNCHGAPPGGPPHAITGRPTSVGATSVRLNAAVNPQSRATTYRFEYGPTPSYGSATSADAVSPVNSAHRQVSAQLSGLAPGATYHYRVIATSAAGESVGADRSFTVGTPADRYAATIASTPGLRSYWRLGETAGTFEFDEQGLELGTYTGGVSLGQPGALAGAEDRAVGFDGVDGEMLGTGPVVSTTATLEGWFRWQAGKTLLRDDSWAAGWVLAYENVNGNLGYRVGGKAFSTGTDVDTLARDGAWHHIAVTKDGPNAAIYLDGTLQHPDSGATNDPAAGPWHVMRDGQHTDYAQGQADEVAIYDAALSAATIRRHYEAGLPATPPPDTPDTTAPETQVDSGPSGTTTATDATFTFSSSEPGSSFECRLDGGAWWACASPTTYSDLPLGQHAFEVRATDPAENTDATPATQVFTVVAEPDPDTTPPDTSIAYGPTETTTAADAELSFSSPEPDATFECRLDGGAWEACSPPTRYAGLAQGSHTFDVRAIDTAGNPDDSPASWAWTVEREAAPAPPSDAGPRSRDYRPRGYAVTSGRVFRGRGGLRRLHRNDRNRLEIAAVRRKGSRRYAAAFVARTFVARRASVSRLTLRYDGGVSRRGASIAVRMYDFRKRRWIAVSGPVRARRADRRIRWWVTAGARRYISARGEVRVRVRATARRSFRTRTDLIRLTLAS